MIGWRKWAAGIAAVLWLGAGPAWAQNAEAEWQQHLQTGARAYGLAQLDIAETEFNAALAIAEKTFPPDDPRLITTWLNLTPMRRAQGRYDEATAFGEKAIAAMAKLGGDDNPDLMAPLGILAAIYRDTKQFDKSDKNYLRTIALHEEYYGEVHPRTITMQEDRAVMLHMAGRDKEASELWAQVVEMWPEGLGPNHLRQAVSYRGYAEFLRSLGKNDEAAAAERRAEEITNVWDRGR